MNRHLREQILGHIGFARAWLERAEGEFKRDNRVGGEMHLSLVEAEVRHAWEESRGLPRGEIRPRPVVRRLSAVLFIGMLAVALFSGFSLFRFVFSPPELTRTPASVTAPHAPAVASVVSGPDAAAALPAEPERWMEEGGTAGASETRKEARSLKVTAREERIAFSPSEKRVTAVSARGESLGKKEEKEELAGREIARREAAPELKATATAGAGSGGKEKDEGEKVMDAGGPGEAGPAVGRERVQAASLSAGETTRAEEPRFDLDLSALVQLAEQTLNKR